MLKIRKALKTDLQEIYNLVIELAIYENEPDAVTASLQMYEDAFSKDKIKILVAELDAKVIGMMIYYWTFSTWKGPMHYLEDFVISQAHRNQGIGQALFNQFLIESKADGVTMVKWQVLDWNKPAIDFYVKNKATIEKDWWNVKIIF